MQLLPGFRDFYPEDCARRNYILATWREVARRYGFVEYDGPVLEPMELYQKKSGGELVGQLFDFTDKGERHVAMRPEMTPTLARMVAARERDFKKPLKWFCCSQFFRYEKQQRGRLREFYQFNCDLIGGESDKPQTQEYVTVKETEGWIERTSSTVRFDAEILALLIDTFRLFGFTSNDIVVRISHRGAWKNLLESRDVATDDTNLNNFLSVIDKIEREKKEVIEEKLKPFFVDLETIESFMRDPSQLHALPTIREEIKLRDPSLDAFVEFDLSIARGLAYYTGLVFEVFDRSKNERALAGGGRYDKLLSLMSDGKVDLPALGFGMGDVVLANLINDTPHAKAKMDAWIAQNHACEIFVVIAKEDHRADALAIIQQLRDAGLRVDFPLTAAKVGKQFQTAEQLRARLAVLIGDEWPQVKIKTLATREETLVPHEELLTHITALTACHSEQSEEPRKP